MLVEEQVTFYFHPCSFSCLDFRTVHVYSHKDVDAKAVARRIVKIFPRCKVDVRRPFQYDSRIERAMISDLKQPFEKQPKPNGTILLYDGYELQRIFVEMIPAKEAGHVHVIFIDLLTCTFSEEDWRYHGRAVVCGSPSIISTSGIVEAPAKPREFYLAQLAGIADAVSLKKKLADRFIDYGDDRIARAAAAYALQALFFFVTDGEPFCDDKDCLLYNAHWQEELVHILERGELCARHRKMANKFNKAKANR
jgi:hypothetical protein